jgi:hypothetical protein
MAMKGGGLVAAVEARGDMRLVDVTEATRDVFRHFGRGQIVW